MKHSDLVSCLLNVTWKMYHFRHQNYKIRQYICILGRPRRIEVCWGRRFILIPISSSLLGTRSLNRMERAVLALFKFPLSHQPWGPKVHLRRYPEVLLKHCGVPSSVHLAFPTPLLWKNQTSFFSLVSHCPFVLGNTKLNKVHTLSVHNTQQDLCIMLKDRYK